MERITFIAPYFKNVWEPLSLGYLASYVCANTGIDAKILHENFHSYEEIIAAVKKSAFVALTSTTPTFERCKILAKTIRAVNPACKIIIGGWHVSALPKEYEEFDYVVVGEGEAALVNIIENEPSSKIIYGRRMEFIELYWPKRPLQWHTLKLCESQGSGRIGSFQSRRGCQNNCAICAESSMTGKYNAKTNPVRVRDPEDLLDEITVVNQQYHLTKFKFVDPTWCFPKQAVYDFCEAKLKSRRIRRVDKLPWEAMAHAAHLDEDLLKLMKKAGCEQINIGCESGSQKILNDMRKGVTVEQIKRVFKWGKSLGINMRAFFVLGMPNETKETIEETKELIRSISPNVVGATILTPFPGSDFYSTEYEQEDWSRCDEYSCHFWKSKGLSNQELINAQKEIETEFLDKLNWHQKCIKENIG